MRLLHDDLAVRLDDIAADLRYPYASTGFYYDPCGKKSPLCLAAVDRINSDWPYGPGHDRPILHGLNGLEIDAPADAAPFGNIQNSKRNFKPSFLVHLIAAGVGMPGERTIAALFQKARATKSRELRRVAAAVVDEGDAEAFGNMTEQEA